MSVSSQPTTHNSQQSMSPPTTSNGGLLADLRILWHMVTSGGRGKTHEERLENFYSGQATGYDAFRKRMLHGRQELFTALPAVPGGVWVDLGAGTGENAEHWGEKLSQFSKAYLVDLSSSLLTVADQRIQARSWTNVVTAHADATKFVPPEGQADVVTMSYSLTMIPDWFLAVDQAYKLLKPGGIIGIVDFFVARKYPANGLAKHRWSTRTIWPAWFAGDNVFLNPDHIPYLQSRFETQTLEQRRGKIPYLPVVRAPYYWFIGGKSS